MYNKEDLLRSHEIFSKQECLDVAKLLNSQHRHVSGNRLFLVECRCLDKAVYTTATLRNKDGSFFYPVDTRIVLDQQNLDKREASLCLFNFIDTYFQEFFREEESVYLPIDWTDFTIDRLALQAKGQILNLVLEKMADHWLLKNNEKKT